MKELQQLRADMIESNQNLTNYKSLAELEQSQTDRYQSEIKTLKEREKLLQSMLDESSILESDPSATHLLLKKEIQQLNELIDLTESRNSFLKEVNDELNLKLIQSEKSLDQKDKLLMLLIRAENKRSHIIATQLGELRNRFAGSVPIDQIQRYQTQLDDVQEKQITLTKELESVRSDRAELVAKIGEYQLKQLNLEEVINTINHGPAEQKLIKWQQNAETAKLNELKFRRQIGQLETENVLLKNQLTKRTDVIVQLERELGLTNQRSLSIDILRSQHDAIVEELKRNLDADNEVRRRTRQLQLETNITDIDGDRHLKQEITGLRANLAGMMSQFNQLKTDFVAVKSTLIEKEKKLVEQEQITGEYKLKLEQIKASQFAEGQDSLRAKQELASDMIGFADLSSQLVVLEQRAANAEARLSSKSKESEIRAQTISRLEERIREGRDERLKLERTHDERMAAFKKQLNEDHMRHAQELRSTQQTASSSFHHESRQLDLDAENRQLKMDLEKRSKNIKLLLERMKKQQEIVHQMKKRILHLESAEKALNADFVEMEKSYQNKIDKLQQQQVPNSSSRARPKRIK